MSLKLFLKLGTGEDSLKEYLIINRQSIILAYRFDKNKEAHRGLDTAPYVLTTKMNTFISYRGCNPQDESKDLPDGNLLANGSLKHPRRMALSGYKPHRFYLTVSGDETSHHITRMKLGPRDRVPSRMMIGGEMRHTVQGVINYRLPGC